MIVILMIITSHGDGDGDGDDDDDDWHDNDYDDHMLDNANAWAPHLSWWVGSIEEKEAQSVLRITPRLMNLFKGPSETSMYFKLHPPACYAVSLQQQQLRVTTLGD